MADYKQSAAPPMATGYPAGDPYPPPNPVYPPQGPSQWSAQPPPMPGFQPQAPAQWSTGLCDCTDDCGNSCGTSGALYALILALTGCQCLYSCAYRSKLRAHYALPESPCNDCLVHCCCEPCALCQAYRELQNRGFDMALGWHGNMEKMQGTQMVQPPPVQGAMMR